MQHALIVAHGQPSDPFPAEEALRSLAARVDATIPDITVHSATLATPDRLEKMLAQLPDSTAIYPLFMARGWFVNKALPERLGSRPLHILEPLGTDADLPGLVATALLQELERLKWEPEATDLVLAAHGSGRSRNPARVATEFADKLTKTIRFKSTRIGFVEEEPSIAQAAAGMSAQSLCLPFFACAGGHALEDVPQALSEAEFKGNTMPVIGELPPIPAHIGRRLKAYFSV